VGTLRRRSKGCEFQYEESFLNSSESPIALHLPKTREPLTTEGILNLPPFFAGLLPEGVMLSAAQFFIRSSKDDLFAVLAATGSDSVGDVQVQVPGAFRHAPSILNLDEAKDVINAILHQQAGRWDAIAAIAGVQPKLSLGGIVRATRTVQYIAKFPPPEFCGLVDNEDACMTLAQKCGLRTPRHRVQGGAYIVERFDRDSSEGVLRKLHVEDMLQIMNLFPSSKYAHDFLELCRAMESLGVSKAGILDAIRLYAFSYIVGNGDLHAKNVSLIRNPNGQWVPSPIYDVVSTLPYKRILDGADRMALALESESFGRFELGEFAAFGERFGIPEKATVKAVAAIAKKASRHASSVLSHALPADDLDVILERAESLHGSPG
jgi:serine/threonine-protein kinase HipA